jgi:hypothetical protein
MFIAILKKSEHDTELVCAFQPWNKNNKEKNAFFLLWLELPLFPSPLSADTAVKAIPSFLH